MEYAITSNDLGREFVTLIRQILHRLERRQQEGNMERTLFVKAELLLWCPFMERQMCGEEPESLIEIIDNECEHQWAAYLNARASNDRNMTIISLARIRTLSTMQRRIAGIERLALIEKYCKSPRILH